MTGKKYNKPKMTMEEGEMKGSLSTNVESKYKLQNMAAVSLQIQIRSAGIQRETALLYGSLEACALPRHRWL